MPDEVVHFQNVVVFVRSLVIRRVFSSVGNVLGVVSILVIEKRDRTGKNERQGLPFFRQHEDRKCRMPVYMLFVVGNGIFMFMLLI